MEWLWARGTSRLIGAPCQNWTRWSATRGPWTIACKVAKCVAVIASHRRWGFVWILTDIHQIQVHQIRSWRCGWTIGKMGQSHGGIGRGEWMVKLLRVLWGSVTISDLALIYFSFTLWRGFWGVTYVADTCLLIIRPGGSHMTPPVSYWLDHITTHRWLPPSTLLWLSTRSCTCTFLLFYLGI